MEFKKFRLMKWRALDGRESTMMFVTSDGEYILTERYVYIKVEEIISIEEREDEGRRLVISVGYYTYSVEDSTESRDNLGLW